MFTNVRIADTVVVLIELCSGRQTRYNCSVIYASFENKLYGDVNYLKLAILYVHLFMLTFELVDKEGG